MSNNSHCYPIYPMMNRPAKVIILFIPFVLLSTGWSSDISVFKENVVHFLCPDLAASDPNAKSTLNKIESDTSKFLALMSEDGLFSDIDVSDIDTWGRGVQAHAERLLRLARAYNITGHNYSGDAELRSAFVRATTALEELLEPGMEIPGNWWNWEIGLPKSYGPAVLLMEDKMPVDLFQEAIASLTYLIKERPSSWSRTGQNLVWVSTTRLYLGLLTNDTSLLDYASEKIASVCVITTGEGIQPDGSFHQHGPSLQTGSYGSGLALDIGIYALVSENTKWALSNSALDSWLFYLTEGSRWSIYKKYYEPSARGRGIVRHESSGNESALAALIIGASMETNEERPLAASAVQSLNSWDNTLDPSYISLANNIANALPTSAANGFKMFPRSDYAISRSEDWFISLKLLSDRTLAAERYNDEGKQSRNLSSGVTWFLQEGVEWDQLGVRASLDWARLPGTTTEIGLDLSKAYPNGNCYGLRSFVGGTQGPYGFGTAAMEWEALKHQGDSNLQALKSWFFWPGGMIAIGSGIESDSGLPVETTAQQWPMSSSRAPVRTDGVIRRSSQWEEEVTGPAFIEADGWSTWIADGETAHVQRLNQSGRFQDITSSGSDIETNPFLLISFEHGINPQNDGYTYAVFPKEAPGELPFKILRKDNEVHAISFQEEQVQSFVFWEAAEQGFIATETPLIIQSQHLEENTVKLFVSDPAQEINSAHRIRIAAEVISIDTAMVVDAEVIKDNSGNYPQTIISMDLSDGETGELTLTYKGLWDFQGGPPRIIKAEIPPETSDASVRLHFSSAIAPELVSNAENFHIFPYVRIDQHQLSEDYTTLDLWLSGWVGSTEYTLQVLSLTPNDEASTPQYSNRISLPISNDGLDTYIATKDSYVRDGIHASSNYGSSSSLNVKNDGTSYFRETYLNFDLSEVKQSVQEALLKLTINTIGEANQVHHLFTTVNGWKENEINWNNRPSVNSSNITSWELTPETESITIDITNVVNANLRKDLSFVIRSQDNVGSQGWMSYASKETYKEAERPQIIVQESTHFSAWLDDFSLPKEILFNDEDLDGLSDKLEYALGTDPLNASPLPTSWISDSDNPTNTALWLEIPQPLRTDAQISVQQSINMHSWISLENPTITKLGRLRWPVGSHSEAEIFFRLIVD